MRSGNEKPAGNTLCIDKGFEAAWAFFCPSKPCVLLSTDGTYLQREKTVAIIVSLTVKGEVS